MVRFKCSHYTHETELSCSRVTSKLNMGHQLGLAPKKELVRPGVLCLVLGYLVQERH